MGQQAEIVSAPDAGRSVRGGHLTDYAYQRLRDDIITVRLAPGDPLDEKTLSAKLDVGLSPVRNALKRLTLERLAVIFPRRGTFVAEINISDERWLTEIRMELEGLAAALAAERATDTEHETLRALSSRLDDGRCRDPSRDLCRRTQPIPGDRPRTIRQPRIANLALRAHPRPVKAPGVLRPERGRAGDLRQQPRGRSKGRGRPPPRLLPSRPSDALTRVPSPVAGSRSSPLRGRSGEPPSAVRSVIASRPLRRKGGR